jgi:DNA-binding NarL/FixJ family response regulator
VLSITGKIRVFIVDDHAAMREGVTAVVNSQPDMTIVGEASDGPQAIERFSALQPDVSLVDWNLPVVSGDQVIRTLLTEFPEARFIVITALSADELIQRALKAGAKSYLSKETLRRELIPAIRAVYKGQQYLPADIADGLKKTAN